jgi:hypothetical protein
MKMPSRSSKIKVHSKIKGPLQKNHSKRRSKSRSRASARRRTGASPSRRRSTSRQHGSGFSLKSLFKADSPKVKDAKEKAKAAQAKFLNASQDLVDPKKKLSGGDWDALVKAMQAQATALSMAATRFELNLKSFLPYALAMDRLHVAEAESKNSKTARATRIAWMSLDVKDDKRVDNVLVLAGELAGVANTTYDNVKRALELKERPIAEISERIGKFEASRGLNREAALTAERLHDARNAAEARKAEEVRNAPKPLAQTVKAQGQGPNQQATAAQMSMARNIMESPKENIAALHKQFDVSKAQFKEDTVGRPSMNAIKSRNEAVEAKNYMQQRLDEQEQELREQERNNNRF